MKNKYTPALIVLTSLFFMWGLITSLNDILIPHLKAIFTLSYVQAMLIQFCFFGAYFVMSVPSGYLVERVGLPQGIIIGLLDRGRGLPGVLPRGRRRIPTVCFWPRCSCWPRASRCCKSLRIPMSRFSGRAAHCRESPESHTGLQLARHDRRPLRRARC